MVLCTMYTTLRTHMHGFPYTLAYMYRALHANLPICDAYRAIHCNAGYKMACKTYCLTDFQNWAMRYALSLATQNILFNAISRLFF